MRTNAPGQVEDLVPVAAGGNVAVEMWLPEGEARAAVVVHPATATPQRFYRSCATFLAGHGVAAVTYDYRGTGRSGLPREHRSVRMRDWMAQDVPAVAAWTRDRLPRVPHFAVGHSVGGHALALGFGTGGLTAFATVSSHAGVTAAIEDRGERARVGMFFTLAPALSRVLGYAPSRLAGFGEDIPAGVVRDWAPWTRRPDYFFEDPTMQAAERMSRVRLPVLALGAGDDPWATPAQIDAITDRLVSAAVTRRTYEPGDLGVNRVGHHGLLRRGVGEPAWTEIVEWFFSHGTPGDGPGGTA
ncbi:alpha/beta hydrolase family protein [Myceligenerans indicum]|uniref:Alpha/beta fold hydrolase n=1 Tax=Myceligenerans indicum TaxID=2593663 RepID=A0ABS1LRY5_9MICO|nr:alpha/beta hydrolase [Myceligenerans indicum]MBL0888829.1 alpha/beta fold hydrolase [Myceligenerans indicum]